MITRATLRSQLNNCSRTFLRSWRIRRLWIECSLSYNQCTMRSCLQSLYSERHAADHLQPAWPAKGKGQCHCIHTKNILALEARTEWLEQYSRSNTMDEMILDIFNNKKLDPPLSIEDIEASHGVGWWQSISTETVVPEGSDGNDGGTRQ